MNNLQKFFKKLKDLQYLTQKKFHLNAYYEIRSNDDNFCPMNYVLFHSGKKDFINSQITLMSKELGLSENIKQILVVAADNPYNKCFYDTTKSMRKKLLSLCGLNNSSVTE